MGNDVGGPTGGRVDRDNPFWANSPRCVHSGDTPVKASTDGTDSTPVTTEVYIAEIDVRAPIRATGIAMFNGSVASGNMKLGLYNSAGTRIAQTASTAMSGTDAFQRVAFTTPINLKPGVYYIAATYNDTNARFNTHPIGNFGASKKTGAVYNTLPTTITPPTTFTANLGPMGGLY